MDTDTSMEATAALHDSGPIEPAAPTPPVPAAAAPRARTTSFVFTLFPGLSRLPVLVLYHSWREVCYHACVLCGRHIRAIEPYYLECRDRSGSHIPVPKRSLPFRIRVSGIYFFTDRSGRSSISTRVHDLDPPWQIDPRSV